MVARFEKWIPAFAGMTIGVNCREAALMSAELKLLDARIQRLEDIEAIRELRMLYHHYNNEGTYDRLEELYTDDAYIDFQPLGDARGRKAVGELLVGLTNTVVFIKQ